MARNHEPLNRRRLALWQEHPTLAPHSDGVRIVGDTDARKRAHGIVLAENQDLGKPGHIANGVGLATSGLTEEPGVGRPPTERRSVLRLRSSVECTASVRTLPTSPATRAGSFPPPVLGPEAARLALTAQHSTISWWVVGRWR